MDNKKKKVLIFIDWFSPGFKAGGPVTSIANLVEHFRKEIDFYIITRDTDYCEDRPYESVESNKWVNHNEGVSVFYFSKDFLSISNLRRIATEADCDRWYINGIYSFYFSILPLFLGSKTKGIRKTVSARGMLSPHALAVKPLKKKVLLWFLKSLGFYRSLHFHATNKTEAIEIEKQVGVSRGVLIAPNLSKPIVVDSLKVKGKKPGNVKLFSLARISQEKNTLGALEILSHITHHVQLDWFGQVYDENYMSKCQEVINSLPNNIQINFPGSISPEEIPLILDDFHFLFLPTQGENFGHSILEALSAGCPVIISDQTPWRDLKEKGIGWDISLSNLDTFVQIIEAAAAMDQEEYTIMSQAAFAFAKDFTNNPKILKANRDLFDR